MHASVLTKGGAGWDVERAGQHAVATVSHRRHQHLAHAPAGAGHTHAVWQLRRGAHRAGSSGG